MPVEERIALSSPDGVARAVAEDPELSLAQAMRGECSRIACWSSYKHESIYGKVT
jgi:hypothetical protein